MFGWFIVIDFGLGVVLREEEMQDLNRSTNTKMAWLCLLSLFVCIGVAAMQYVHLKTFFEKKKVI